MRLPLLLLAAFALHAQTPANWFNVTNGDTNCHAHLVSTTSLSFFFSCSNPRGAMTGTYIPAATNTATDIIQVGLSSGVGNTGNNICMIAINATANPVTTQGTFAVIPAQSVAFQCAGGLGSTVSIAPIAPALKKGKQ